VKIRSPIPRKKARLEIIPLIDIMFFLLASFMMVSLQMQKVRAINARLPTANLARSTAKPDMIRLRVDGLGQVYVDKDRVSLADLPTLLANRSKLNTNVPVYLSGDRDAKHGSMIYVLDLVKRAGLQNVAVAVTANPSGAARIE
jgi:biopolymer transport protein ExbD